MMDMKRILVAEDQFDTGAAGVRHSQPVTRDDLALMKDAVEQIMRRQPVRRLQPLAERLPTVLLDRIRRLVER